MDFLDNVVKSSNALIKEKLNNPFGSKQSSQQDGDQQQQQQQPPPAPQTQLQTESNQPLTTTTTTTTSSANPSSPTQQSVDDPSTDQQAFGESNQNKNSQFAAIAADAEVVTQKAVKGAKDFGSFLFSMGNKAAQTVSQTAKQVKQAVENTSILTDFTKEQQDFVKEHGGSMKAGELPWDNCDDPAKAADIKEQVLSLSQDKRNFVRSPPNDANFQFQSQQCYPIALSLLKEDPNLAILRFELVPKLVNEETFWRNYFYRVSLLKQISDRGEDVKKQGWASSRSSSGEGPDDDITSNTIDPDNNQEPTSPSYDTADVVAPTPLQTTSNTILNSSTNYQDTYGATNQQQQGYELSSTTNYNNDDYLTQTGDDVSKNLFADDDDLKSKLRELNIGSLDEGGGQEDDIDDEEWDEELQRDLQEFELISGGDVCALNEEDEKVLDNELEELNRQRKNITKTKKEKSKNKNR